MAVNKVIYNNNGTPNVLIDLTEDTATASDVAQGKTFHLANGEQATGTASGGGSGPTPEELTITGDASYKFRRGWGWFIDKYGSQITTNGLTDVRFMFYGSDITQIPFSINFDSSTEVSLQSFINNTNIQSLPAVNNAKPSFLRESVSNNHYLRQIPDNWMDTWDLSYQSSGNGGLSTDTMFSGNYSLRSIPTTIFDKLSENPGYSDTSLFSSGFYCTFYENYVLDALYGVWFNPLWSGTDSAMTYTVYNCLRLKDFTFRLDDNDNPIIGLFKNQTFDLTNVGWVESWLEYLITDYNSGITADKKVTDTASYEALKNDPDWYTTDIHFSRYNHDSAVRTINSLPDTSATGTNIIRFKGDAGMSTDGGAISTLTAAEIAVASAKGWTVAIAQSTAH